MGPFSNRWWGQTGCRERDQRRGGAWLWIPPREIVNLTRANAIDLVVLGGHGHKHLRDLLHGKTIRGVRPGLDIPVLTVR